MARRRRQRRFFKWAGLLASLLLFVAWVVSIPCLIRFDSQRVECLLTSGEVQVTLPNPLSLRGITIHRKALGELNFTPEFSRINQGKTTFRSARIPLWIPFILMAIPTTILWYRDRRPPKDHCQSCGYDLTGNYGR